MSLTEKYSQSEKSTFLLNFLILRYRNQRETLCVSLLQILELESIHISFSSLFIVRSSLQVFKARVSANLLL